MNYVTRNILETGIRVLVFKTEPGVPTTNARANTLFASLGTEITAMETHGTAQAAGAGVVHSGAMQRREIATLLRRKLREITDTAKGLDETRTRARRRNSACPARAATRRCWRLDAPSSPMSAR
jgi:hypothetical protein